LRLLVSDVHTEAGDHGGLVACANRSDVSVKGRFLLISQWATSVDFD